MNTRLSRRLPAYLSAGFIALVCLGQLFPLWLPHLDLFACLEWMTYDWRVRQASRFPHTQMVASNLAAVFLDDDSLRRINQGLSFSWPWPRQLHGRLVRSLKAQGAKGVGFDILFQERQARLTETDVGLQNGLTMESDSFFAICLQQASNVVLAAFGETSRGQWRALMPADLFRTNAFRVAHATS